jgi:hypothetical protein
MKQHWAKTAMILGIVILITDAVLAYLKIQTQLKFVDVTSGNPKWVRPIPTAFDEFFLWVPLGKLLIAGIVVLAVGYVGRRYCKSN